MEDFFKNNPNLFANTNQNKNNNRNLYTKSQDKIRGKIYKNDRFPNNPNNEYMNNYQFGNNSNKGNLPKPNIFIIGKFGKKTVVSQDLKTFMNSIKEAEWTTNPSYLLAKDIKVKPVFSKSNIEINDNIPKYSENINKFYLHLNNINENDYLNYVNEIKSRKNKIDEDVKKEKFEFMKSNFPNEGKLDLKTILNRIRNNHSSFISKDQILFNKISQAMQY